MSAERAHASSFGYQRDATLVEPMLGQVAPLQRRTVPVQAALLGDSSAAGPALATAVQMFVDAVGVGVHPVQFDGDGAGLSSNDVHRAAAHGLSGSGGTLPHLDVIQKSFGRHDVSSISAHVGGRAAEGSAAMGARAFASGTSVGFAASPDIHLAAHEAAHIVQQRGGVQLSGGVGAAGDVYERHADAVADCVTRGESAEALLDQHAPVGASTGVQRAVQLERLSAGRRRPAATPIIRCPAEVDRLVADTLAAIAANEVGGAAVAPPSAMGTSAGVPASYGSATQMIASHAVGVLRSDAGAASASAHGIDETELSHAHDIDAATRQIWAILVEARQPISAIPPRLRARTRFTDEELGQMVRFGNIRARMIAARAGFPARIAAVQAALEVRAAQAGAALDHLAAQVNDVESLLEAPATQEVEPATGDGDGETETETETETEVAGDAANLDPEQVVDDVALTAALDMRAFRALAPLGGVTLPRRWQRMRPARRLTWLGTQQRLLNRARGRIEDLADTAASNLLAQELATNPDAVALELSVSDLRAYIHDGRFNRFGEDRAAWIRVGLQNTAEDHPNGASRSLDGAIASAVEADGGWELSRAEYDGWIRRYIGANRAASDEQVVRAAAAHNGHSAGYPDRIWANYRRLHRPEITNCAPKPP